MVPLEEEDEESEPVGTVEEALQEVAQVQQELRSAEWQPQLPARESWLGGLRAGDRVYLRGIPQPVEVITPPDGGTTLEVLLGTMRARLPVYRVERVAAAQQAAIDHVFLSQGPRPQPKLTLDLRGQRVEDALGEVDLFLDQAVRAGAPGLRIIHGVGSGALRSAIRDYLARHPMVLSFHRDETTAADGATMVEVS